MEAGRMRTYGEKLAASCTVDAFRWYHPSFSLEEFRRQMRDYGFTDKWDMDLLESKYFYGLKSVTIVEEQNFVSQATVSRRLKYLRDELKKRGFKPKRSK